MNKYPTIIFLILFAFLFLSCGEKETPEKLVKENNSDTMAESKQLPIMGETELDSLISNREGKPLLINVWATWCVPCVEEFPDLIALAEEYEGRVDVIGINADMRDDIENQVLPFLEEQKVNFPIFYTGFRKDEDLINSLSPEWSGALPGTFFYEKSGSQVSFHEGKMSYEDFVKNLEPLL